MAKNKLVFLPSWFSYVFIPLIVVIWGYVTYLEYFDVVSKGELGDLGYSLVSAVFIILMLMIYFMTSGRLPAFIIKEDK